MQRIAFVISSQHLIVHGGIGQFFKGFYEQVCKPNGIVVDLVLDQFSDNEIIRAAGFEGKIYYPNHTSMAKYTKHNAIFSFDDSINFEKSINFRDSMFMASKENIYDLVIVNSIDAISGIYCLGLHRFIPVVMYTHLAMMLGNTDVKNTAFSPEFFNYFVSNSMLPGLTIGTQTKSNQRMISSVFDGRESVVLPMPIPEVDLLDKYVGEKDGVLFIGRHEQGKNPDVYVNAVIQSGLKAKIITNSNGAKKFKAAFDAASYTNYEIKVGIVGYEKVAFIKSAKVYFNPSVLESFGFTMLEGLSQLPTLVLEGKQWYDSFGELGFNFHKTSVANAASKLKILHDQEFENDANLRVAQEYNARAIESWVGFVHGIKSHVPTKCKFTSNDNFFWQEFLDGLGRTVSAEDIQNGYRNRGHFNRIQSDRGTWCSASGQEMPKELVGLEDFV